jgi:hypothetical protein
MHHASSYVQRQTAALALLCDWQQQHYLNQQQDLQCMREIHALVKPDAQLTLTVVVTH